jgi:hypothetical protein
MRIKRDKREWDFLSLSLYGSAFFIPILLGLSLSLLKA